VLPCGNQHPGNNETVGGGDKVLSCKTPDGEVWDGQLVGWSDPNFLAVCRQYPRHCVPGCFHVVVMATCWRIGTESWPSSQEKAAASMMSCVPTRRVP